MGGIKFEKPVVITEPLKVPLEVLKIPRLNLAIDSSVEGTRLTPKPVSGENVMKITPQLGQSLEDQYSPGQAMVRFNLSDASHFLQKYQTDLAISEKNLEGITQSLVVYSDPMKGAFSGARKGLAAFLGGELFLKLYFGEFLTGPFAWVSLVFFLTLGGYLGWFVDHMKKPSTSALPEAKVVQHQKRLKP